MNIKEFAEKVKSKEIDIADHTHKIAAEAEKLNKEYNYFNAVCSTQAVIEAQRIRQKPAGKLL